MRLKKSIPEIFLYSKVLKIFNISRSHAVLWSVYLCLSIFIYLYAFPNKTWERGKSGDSFLGV